MEKLQQRSLNTLIVWMRNISGVTALWLCSKLLFQLCQQKRKTKVKVIGFRVKMAYKIRLPYKLLWYLIPTTRTFLYELSQTVTYRQVYIYSYFNICQYVARVLFFHTHTHKTIIVHCYRSHLMCIIYWIWSFHVKMCPHCCVRRVIFGGVGWITQYVCYSWHAIKTNTIVNISFVVVVSVGIKPQNYYIETINWATAKRNGGKKIKPIQTNNTV